MTPALDAVPTAASSSTVVSTEGDEAQPPTLAPSEKKMNANPLSFLANVTLDMFGINKMTAPTSTENARQEKEGDAETTPVAVVATTKNGTKKKPKSGVADVAVSSSRSGSTKKKVPKKTAALSQPKAPSSAPASFEKKRKSKGGNGVVPAPRKARKGDADRVVEAMTTPSSSSAIKNAMNYKVDAAVAAKVSGKVREDDDDSSAKEDSAEYNAYLASYASAVRDARSVLDRAEPPSSRLSEDMLSRQHQLEHEMEALRNEGLAVLRERELAHALREQELVAALRQQRQQNEMLANMEATLGMNDYGASLGGPTSLSRLELQIQQEMQRQQQALLECRLLNGPSLGPPAFFSPSGFGGAASMSAAEASYLAGLTRGRIGSIPSHLLPMQNAHQMTEASRLLASGALTNPITGETMAPASEPRLMMNRASSSSMGAPGGGSSPAFSAVRPPAADGTSGQANAAPKRLAPARGVFNKNVKTQDEVLDSLARANSLFFKGDQGKKSGQRFRSYQCEQWTSKFQELLNFKDQMGNCQVPHAYKKNIELARWVKRQRYQYKLMVEGKQSTMTAERVKLLEGIGFIWDSHAATWEERLNELRDYASVHGDCNVPSSFRENPKLATWIKCQRR
jgi:hypothetical protein